MLALDTDELVMVTPLRVQPTRPPAALGELMLMRVVPLLTVELVMDKTLSCAYPTKPPVPMSPPPPVTLVPV